MGQERRVTDEWRILNGLAVLQLEVSGETQGAKEILARAVASGRVEEAGVVLVTVTRAQRYAGWKAVADGVSKVLGDDRELLASFLALPAETRLQMWDLLTPYAEDALAHGYPGALVYLLGYAIATGEERRARSLVDKLAHRGAWKVLAEAMGLVLAGGPRPVFLHTFRKLPERHRLAMWRLMFPLGLGVAEHVEGMIGVMGAGALVAQAIVEGWVGEVSEVLQGLAEREAWKAISYGISVVFGWQRAYRRWFKKLPAEVQERLWHLLFPWLVRATVNGGEDEERNLEVVLERFRNPTGWDTETWKRFAFKHADALEVSLRPEFLEAVVTPRLRDIRTFERFTPEEWAWIVMRYLEEKGWKPTSSLVKAVNKVSASSAEHLSALAELANAHVGVIPLINAVVGGKGSYGDL